jgi:hypothetical protein
MSCGENRLMPILAGLAAIQLTAGLLSAQPERLNEGRKIPPQVSNWVSKNLPEWEFPPVSFFFGEYLRPQDLSAFLKSNRNWPPFCIGGDFDGQGGTDYALILSKKNVVEGVSYRIIALNESKGRLVEVENPIKHEMGGVKREISTRLVILPKGTHRGGSGNSAELVKIARDSISIIDGYNQYYWVWGRDGYKEKSLYAD